MHLCVCCCCVCVCVLLLCVCVCVCVYTCCHLCMQWRQALMTLKTTNERQDDEAGILH